MFKNIEASRIDITEMQKDLVMILIMNLKDSKKEPEMINTVKKYSKYYKVKSRNVSSEKCNLIVEVRVKEEYEMVQEISGLEGITNVSLVSHDGEVTF